MPITVPTADSLTQAAQDLLTQVGITNFAADSVASTLISLLVNNQLQLFSLLQQAENARNIDTAQGTDLDNLGRAFGVTRFAETTAGADSGAAQVLVTNTSSSAVTFPVGSAVWSTTNPGNRYYTTSTLTIPAASSAAVQVQAGTSGIYQNAATGTLNAQNGTAALTVTNFLPIVGGGSAESDEEFRYRLSQTIQMALLGGASSEQAITNTLLNTPSISDVVLTPGTGTLNVLVVPATGYSADDDFLSSVQELLSGCVAAGVTTTVTAPTPLWIDTEISLTVSGDNITPLGSLQTLLQTIVQNYLNGLQVYVQPKVGRLTQVANGNSTLNYTTLQGLLLSAATAQLGSKLLNLNLLLSTSQGQIALQGNISPRSGEIIQSRSIRVTTTSSS